MRLTSHLSPAGRRHTCIVVGNVVEVVKPLVVQVEFVPRNEGEKRSNGGEVSWLVGDILTLPRPSPYTKTLPRG